MDPGSRGWSWRWAPGSSPPPTMARSRTPPTNPGYQGPSPLPALPSTWTLSLPWNSRRRRGPGHGRQGLGMKLGKHWDPVGIRVGGKGPRTGTAVWTQGQRDQGWQLRKTRDMMSLYLSPLQLQRLLTPASRRPWTIHMPTMDPLKTMDHRLMILPTQGPDLVHLYSSAPQISDIETPIRL